MKIREFLISLVSRADLSGFDEVEAAAARMGDTAEEAAKQTDELAGSSKRAGKAAEAQADGTAKAGKEAKKAGEATERAGKQARDAGGKFRKAGGDGRKAATDWKAAGAALADVGKTIAGGIVGLGALSFGALTVGAGAVAQGVIETGISFESLRARLKTVEGPLGDSAKAFELIQDFTKSTPFELDQVTEAYVRLKSLGLDASRESLTAFGNIAAAQGKNIIDFIEAVADASTGEFERLKEFGIKASTEGNKVAFTFQGVTTKVGKNAEEIQAFLRGIGETTFAGAAGDLSLTAEGQISNLRDAVKGFFDEVAQLGVLDEFKALLTDISGLAGEEGDGLAKILADALIKVLRSLREALANISAEDIKGFFEAAHTAASALATAIGIVADALEAFTAMSGGTENALINMTAAVTALALAFTGPAGLVVAAGLAGAAIGNMIYDIDAVELSVDKLISKIVTAANTAGDLANKMPGVEIAGKRFTLGNLGQGPLGLALALADNQVGPKAQGLGTTIGALTPRATERGTGQEAIDNQGQMVQIQRRGGAGERTFASIETLSKIAGGEITDASISREQATGILEQVLAEDIAANRERALARGQQEAAAQASKRPKGKGKAAKDPYDFAVKAAAEAKKQAAEFAEREFQRLRFEGLAVEEALAQSKEAGKARAAELEKQFLAAGRIYDTNTRNILDVLGLTGVGSVLEGRPPPSTVIINISPEINLIREFHQAITFAGSQTPEAGTEQATASGVKAAAERGAVTMAEVNKAIEDMFNLRADALMKLGAGGRQPRGTQT